MLQEKQFLTALDHYWQQQRTSANPQGELPFNGGWFIYLSYELMAEIEPSVPHLLANSKLPIAQATRIPAAIIYDHSQDQTHLITEPAFAQYLSQMRTDLVTSNGFTAVAASLYTPMREEPAQSYLDNVERALNYIRAGDVFQVNLARIWSGQAPAGLHPADIYARLRKTNPAPFGGIAWFEAGTLVSSSPERLVRVKGTTIQTRPIAGTRPRATSIIDDTALQQELLAHPKERAEHIMLIDLERNDLGRLCIPGSVKVTELMALESYAHVHHLVSNIQGALPPGTTPGAVIRAVFPGGTITGCPKVRCMEIIAELEQTARGPYTGSMGYLTHQGDLDLNILIRTITVQDQQVSLRAGAGIVADSIPQRELDETRAKAKGMLQALQVSTQR